MPIRTCDPDFVLGLLDKGKLVDKRVVILGTGLSALYDDTLGIEGHLSDG